jgi:hypothetical protein
VVRPPAGGKQEKPNEEHREGGDLNSAYSLAELALLKADVLLDVSIHFDCGETLVRDPRVPRRALRVDVRV